MAKIAFKQTKKSFDHVKEYSAAPRTCIFNRTFDVAGGPIEVHQSLFNKLHRSMQGIETISRILTASAVAQDNMGEEPLNGNLVGGLTDAIQALSEYSLDAMERLVERNARIEDGDE